MAGRPPLKEAREEATRKLIADHGPEFQMLVDKELAKRGWGQAEITVTKWVKNGDQG